LNKNQIINEMIKIELLYRKNQRKKKLKFLNESSESNESSEDINTKFWNNFFDTNFTDFLTKSKLILSSYNLILQKLNDIGNQFVQGNSLNIEKSKFDEFKSILSTCFDESHLNIKNDFIDNILKNNKQPGNIMKFSLEMPNNISENMFDINSIDDDSINKLYNLYNYFNINEKSLGNNISLFEILSRNILSDLTFKLEHAITKKLVGNVFQTSNPITIQMCNIISNKLRNCNLQENQVAEVCNKLFTNNLSIDNFSSIFKFPFSAYNKDDLQKDNSPLFKKLSDKNFRKNFYAKTIYNVVAPSGATNYNTGKGEFLLLSLLDNFTSGGSRSVDLISKDRSFEVEVKQVVEKAVAGSSDKVILSTNSKFRISLRQNKNSTKTKTKFFDKFNDFVKKFSQNTKGMNNLLKLTDQLETIAFNESTMLLNVGKDYGPSPAQTSDSDISRLLDIDEIDAAKIKSIISYSGKPADSAVKEFVVALDKEYANYASAPGSKQANNKITQALANLDGQGKFITNQKIDLDNVKGLFDWFKAKTPEDLNKLKNSNKKFFLFNSLVGTNGTIKGGTIYDEKNPTHKEYEKCFVSAYDVYKNLKKSVESLNIYGDLTSLNDITSTQIDILNVFFFNNIVNKYLASLMLYNDFLNNMSKNFENLTNNVLSSNNEQNEINKLWANIKFDVVNKIKEMNLSNLDLSELKDPLQKETFKDLLKYKVFTEFSESLGLNDEEIIVTFKHLDSNKKVKSIKKVINKINPDNLNDENNEFNILEPNAITNIDQFFNDKNNKQFTIKINNDELTDEQIENILSNKSMFSFFSKSNLTKKENDSDLKVVEPINNDNDLKVVEPINDSFIIKNKNILKEDFEKLINEKNKYIIDYLDGVIKTLIELHESIQEDYSKNAVLILSEEDSESFNRFRIMFGPNNKTNYSDIKSDDEVIEKFASGKALFITSIKHNEIVLMQNPESEADSFEKRKDVILLYRFLKLKKDLNATINEIDEVKNDIRNKSKVLMKVFNLNKFSEIPKYLNSINQNKTGV